MFPERGGEQSPGFALAILLANVLGSLEELLSPMALTAGCYLSHGLDAPDAAMDVGIDAPPDVGPPDAGPDTGPDSGRRHTVPS